jgi:hypothetical protein
VPVVATVDGVKVKFYYDDHPPPHFHASFAEFEVQMEIETLQVIVGELPGAKLRKVRAWAESRADALRAAWIACESGLDPGRLS